MKHYFIVFATLLLLPMLSLPLPAQSISEDFDLPDGFDRVWEGDNDDFEIIANSPVPGGMAVPRDGSSYLASKDGSGAAALNTESNFTDEWQFSLASSEFTPLSSNFFGVILMSSAVISGDILNANWNGYFIRVARSGSTSPIELLRHDGTATTLIGAFPDSPNFADGALKNGLDIRITRSASGEFELFFKTGFKYDNTPFSRGGTITDNTHTTSFYFGVFVKFNTPNLEGRVYIDNIVIGDDGDDPPEVKSVSRTPEVPLQNENLTVTTVVTDDFDVNLVEIRYIINNGDTQFVDITNSQSNDTTYFGDIPATAYNNGDRVTFWVYAEDNATATQAAESSRSNFFAGVTSISTLKATDGNGVLLFGGYDARVAGVATVRNGVFSNVDLDVYIQDGSGGINIFQAGAVGTSFIRNNNYTIVGNLAQTNGQTQINPPSSITDNGTGTPPSPLVRTIAQVIAAQEALEGMLIGIQHIENTNGANTWPGAGKDANIQIKEISSSTTMIMYINKFTDIPGTIEPVWPRDVAGILIQTDAAAPFTEGYRVTPRSTADIQEDGALPVTLSTFSAKVANGNVLLEWATESELNNLGFEIMRSFSQDGNFQMIGWLDGQFTTSQRTEYEFTDDTVLEDFTYWYKLVDVDVRGVRTEHGPISITVREGESSELDLGIPKEFNLHSNFPNPFNPSTTLRFDVPVTEQGQVTVTIDIFNALGQKVRTLLNKEFSAGTHDIVWNATSDFGLPLPAGVYYAVLRTSQFSDATKMILLK